MQVGGCRFRYQIKGLQCTTSDSTTPEPERMLILDDSANPALC